MASTAMPTQEPSRRPGQRMPMKFRQGCMILGDAAYGHSSVKFKPRRRHFAADLAETCAESVLEPSPGQEASTSSSSMDASKVERVVPRHISDEVQKRTERLVDLLLSCQLSAPSGVPQQGRIVKLDAIAPFVERHRQLALLRGFSAALPRIVYHWTQERNFEGITEGGLRVPDGAGVAVAHGSSFGVGVYVSPDFRYGRELFSYGANAGFMCLALPGKQHFGKPPAGTDGQYEGLYGHGDDGYDSVVGREGQRGVDEWVFFRTDQLLACFIVDQTGLAAAKEAMHRIIKALHQPWPEEADEEDAVDGRADAEDVGKASAGSEVASEGVRWRRHAPTAPAEQAVPGAPMSLSPDQTLDRTFMLRIAQAHRNEKHPHVGDYAVDQRPHMTKAQHRNKPRESAGFTRVEDFMPNAQAVACQTGVPDAHCDSSMSLVENLRIFGATPGASAVPAHSSEAPPSSKPVAPASGTWRSRRNFERASSSLPS